MCVGFVVCMCVFQLCPAFCHPMDYSLPASFVREILQTKIVEWVSFPSPGHLPDPGSDLHLSCLLHGQVCSLPLVKDLL